MVFRGRTRQARGHWSRWGSMLGKPEELSRPPRAQQPTRRHLRTSEDPPLHQLLPQRLVHEPGGQFRAPGCHSERRRGCHRPQLPSAAPSSPPRVPPPPPPPLRRLPRRRCPALRYARDVGLRELGPAVQEVWGWRCAERGAEAGWGMGSLKR